MNRIDHLGRHAFDPRIGRHDPIGESSKRQDPVGKRGTPTFQEMFQKEIGQGKALQFSNHARDRLTSRDIQFTQQAMDRLNDAVDRAAAKGARDALVLIPGVSRTDDLALVVSVVNRTVVTAMDGERMQESVFTNIDSAVVLQ